MARSKCLPAISSAVIGQACYTDWHVTALCRVRRTGPAVCLLFNKPKAARALNGFVCGYRAEPVSCAPKGGGEERVAVRSLLWLRKATQGQDLQHKLTTPSLRI